VFTQVSAGFVFPIVVGEQFRVAENDPGDLAEGGFRGNVNAP
jgi:hypothetical protein